MVYLDKEFLEDIKKDIFPGHSPSEVQINIFMERFLRNNYPIKNIEIGRHLEKKHGHESCGTYSERINQHMPQIIRKTYNAFADELNADDIFPKHLGLDGNAVRGNPGTKRNRPWEVIWNWLWQTKYPLWVEDFIWNKWCKESREDQDWIQLCVTEEFNPRGFKFNNLPEPESPVPVNTPITLKINIDHPGEYLILLNRGSAKNGTTTKNLIAPSCGIPQYQLVEPGTLLTYDQKNEIDFHFDAEGKEEYLGILIKESLDIDWLKKPASDEPLEWQGEHLEEIWNSIHNKNSCQIFYRNFEVVSTK